MVDMANGAFAHSAVQARLPPQRQKSPGRKLPMNRRELFKAAAALPLSQIALSNTVFAQAPWPTRNITMIVPFPAGGQADLPASPRATARQTRLRAPGDSG